MLWVAPSEKDTATDTLEKRLWEASDQLRANSGLTSAQYSTPVLGLIFLPFADVRFTTSSLRSLRYRGRRPTSAAPATFWSRGCCRSTCCQGEQVNEVNLFLNL
jgi:type I restriction enzyme M protein